MHSARRLHLDGEMISSCSIRIALLAGTLAATGCASFGPLSRPESPASERISNLVAIVSELQIHLRDDTYRFEDMAVNAVESEDLSHQEE